MHEEGGHLLIAEAHGVEHAGPVDCVGGHEDVFTDDVGIGRPERFKVGEVASVLLAIAREGDVVDESVEPDVGDKVRIEGDLDAPVQALFGAGNTQVGFFGSLDGVEYFLAPKLWNDAEVAGVHRPLEPVCMIGEFEVPVLLFAFFHFAPLRAELSLLVPILFSQVLLLSDGVEPLVWFLVELALLVQSRKNTLHALLVALVSGFRPAVELDPELLPKREELLRVPLCQGGHIHFFLLGGLDHLVPMLIHAGEEEDLIAS